jgi:hypothetical protein
MSNGEPQLLLPRPPLVEVSGKTNVPTILYYADQDSYIGEEALELCPDEALLYEDFKVALGKHDISSLIKKQIDRYGRTKKTPLRLTQDFIDTALKHVDRWLAKRDQAKPTHIVVAEPIAMGTGEVVNDNWLQNYRTAVKRVLASKFTVVDFLPEPFAAFQYYRYGVRHPLVAEKRQHTVLVVDFGGGTFDVCIIETNREGDIRERGASRSKPLSASSRAVGGFFINKLIADELLFEALQKGTDRSAVRKAIERYYAYKEDTDFDLEELREDVRDFFYNYARLLRQVERGKIYVCSRIVNWDLSSELGDVAKYPINVPTAPFRKHPQTVEIRLDASRLRNIFERIWKQHLKPAVSQTLKGAAVQLRGQDISVILLSGGSSNIGWLREFLKSDVRDLAQAEVLELRENFQEVVAKGLAIECARKFFKDTHTGDFHAVTYNQLCLALRSDEGELEILKFRPDDAALGEGLDNGVLLHSASSLGDMLNISLGWKFKLSKPPRRQLEYFFMASSVDPEDLKNLHNVDRRIFTPPSTNFNSMQLQLLVREDGTTTPTFIYGAGGRDGTARQVDGVSFALPMTFGGADRSLPNSYVGLDFGSSSSSISVVSERDISVWNERSRNPGWLEINDLSQVLPYPAAAPLAHFIAETRSTERLEELGRESVEGILAVAAYVAYMEYCAAQKQPRTYLLKGMAHRSAGPLWGLLKQTLEATSSANSGISMRMRVRLEPAYDEIDKMIDNIANRKHGKLSEIDYPRMLAMLGNTLLASLNGWLFGSFEDVQKKKFAKSFIGTFREIIGPGVPFINVYNYEGQEAFSEEGIYLYNRDDNTLFPLTPLMFWYRDEASNRDEGDLYIFDAPKPKMSSIAFKSVQPREELAVVEGGDLEELYRAILEMRQQDQVVRVYANAAITRRGGEPEILVGNAGI